MSLLFKILIVASLLCGLLLVAGLAVWPRQPAPMDAINNAVLAIDRIGLPNVAHVVARDGGDLAFRRYNPGGAPFVMLIHGSGGNSLAVHALAASLAKGGADVVAPDMRGHGASGPVGDIGPDVDLSEDVADLLDRLSSKANERRILVGHSSGGGFALRVSATAIGERFSRTVLLSPYLGWDQPTSGPDGGAWAQASVPRIVALTLLRDSGRRWLGHLPVLKFAQRAGAPPASASYSFRLFDQFRTRDALADFAAARTPVDIIAGEADELMVPSRYAAMASRQRSGGGVVLLPGVGHMQIVTDASVTPGVAEYIFRIAALQPAPTSP